MKNINSIHDLIKEVTHRLDTPYCELESLDKSKYITMNHTRILAWDGPNKHSGPNSVIALYGSGDGIYVSYEMPNPDGYGYKPVGLLIDDPELCVKFYEVRERLWDYEMGEYYK